MTSKQTIDCPPGEPLGHPELANLMAVALHCRNYFSKPQLLAYGMATTVLRHYLGKEWNDVNLSDLPAETRCGHPDNRKFLIDMPGKEFYDFRFHERVISLAERLYELRKVPGIEHRRAMLQCENVETALGELDCASLISKFSLRFVVPTGKKGSDYEAEVTTPAGRTVCCEIKTKRRTTVMSKETVLSTLETARKQLPKGHPGMVLLKLPDHWEEPSDSDPGMQAIEKIFRQSNRIVAVVRAWNTWEQMFGGWGTSFSYRLDVNDRSPLYDNDILRLFPYRPLRPVSFGR